jgi:GT2 family glycosyltransferase
VIPFTVIVATCDRPDRLHAGLARIADAVETAGAGALVVADNGAEHAAGEAVRRVAAAAGFPVRYLQTPPRNKSKALNAAIAAAETEWLAFTDDDTLPDADWLKNAAAFASAGRCRVFGGRILAGQPDAPLPAWMQPDANGEYPGHGVFVRYYPLRQSGLLGPADRVPFGANVFVRKDVFTQRGGYDERLWEFCGRAALGAEDGEFGMRLQRLGEAIGYCHEAVVVHPVHADRCRWRTQLRLAFYYGWRDPIVDFDARRPLVEGYRLRQCAAWSARAAVARVTGRTPAAFVDSLKAARALGSMLCRFSAGYRNKAAEKAGNDQ